MGKTKETPEQAYEMAWRAARVFSRNHKLPHMDVEDYVQEAMIGWFQGRNIYYAMISAFRKAAPLSLHTFKARGGTAIPHFVAFDETYGEATHVNLEDKIDQRRVTQLIEEIDEERVQFVIKAMFYMGMSAVEISEILQCSRAWVYVLREKGLQQLRDKLEEASC